MMTAATGRGYVRLNATQKGELDEVQEQQADLLGLRLTRLPAGRVVQALARLGRKHPQELAQLITDL